MNQRLSSRWNALALTTVAVAVTLLGIAACFSGRASTDATTAVGDCVAPSSAAGATVVFIQSVAFAPSTIHVKAGSSVVWVNCEPTAISHTSTSDAAGWNSGILTKGQAFVHTFGTAGTFPYHCDVHPFMKATVIVD
ncbi:MAG TPA: plastocyanin/azurin family copper-binding protein [Gemmatimonadaceae bacterium]|jgi:plastocyanin